MVEKRSKSSQRDETESTTLIAPSDLTQSSPSDSAQSQPHLPELILPKDVGEQHTTGVDDQPKSPDVRDDEFLSLLRQAPG
jgi:hypothetical protein